MECGEPAKFQVGLNENSNNNYGNGRDGKSMMKLHTTTSQHTHKHSGVVVFKYRMIVLYIYSAVKLLTCFDIACVWEYVYIHLVNYMCYDYIQCNI